MPIELRTQRDGRFRKTWYGRYEVNGRLHYVNLGVKITGQPPVSRSLKDEGDVPFERSRATAQAALDAHLAEIRSKQGATHLVEKIYEIKTGEQIKSVKLDDLCTEWARIPRRRKPNARYAAQCQSALGKFVTFVKAQNSTAVEMAQVTRPIARAFMESETGRGVTAKTWNDTLKLLRATFKYPLPAGAINPFSDMPTQETATVFRKPFTPEELRAIVDVARGDEFIHPLIVTGICTAMRRGDCCLLKWKDVDLQRRFITVKTAKTGVTVSIPIFPMLYDELARREVRGAEFVFPDQAATYRDNPDFITKRVKKILARALGEIHTQTAPRLPELSNEEIRQRGFNHLVTLPDGDKKERMTAVFKCYMDGKNINQVANAAGVSKGSVSGYLTAIEKAVGCRFVRGRVEGTGRDEVEKTGQSLLRAEREHGRRAASIRDFHSFRVTWVTLALTAGVPLELVQKVTGHKTTDIVLKHYFQPGREAFRQALHNAMPHLLTNGQKSPKDEMREILDQTTAKTWKQDCDRMKKLLESL